MTSAARRNSASLPPCRKLCAAQLAPPRRIGFGPAVDRFALLCATRNVLRGFIMCVKESGQIFWDAAAAAHLLRRAAFGGTPEQVEELAALGMEKAVEWLLADAAPDAEPPPTDPSEMERHRQLRLAQRNGGQETRVAMASFLREQRRAMQDLRYWWLGRMRADAGAAREKLALFWHGHFATSQTKVKSTHLMTGQNRTLRGHATGSFGELCAAMARDPAMLVWLDGTRSEARSPNENFAREVMELFALGEGHYTEEDIREAARCFTGWRVQPGTGNAVFLPRRHDRGAKTLFGRTGGFGLDEAVDIICAQPRCAEFLAAKLWTFYAYPQPAPDLVKSLAAHYRENDLCTGDLLRVIFTHPEFYAPRARATQVKSPVQWLVQAGRETGRQLLPPGLALPLAAELGQNLFLPPSVKGWDGGTSWINSATMIRRSNTARLFAVAAPPLPAPAPGSMSAAAWSVVAPEATRTGAAALSDRLRKVFLAVPPGPATCRRLDAALAACDFPCDDETVREASIVLLGCPEYNLC